MDDEKKLKGYTTKEWMESFVLVLDGNSLAHDIHNQTGLSMVECEKLSNMFNSAVREG